MESTIYVAEASAFIEGIHVLKQWIYDGSAQLLVPERTLRFVEEAYKASIAPKDAPKQQSARQSGRPNRKEVPLFDINPRTAWEFIERARSEKGVKGVIFQQDTQVFTQWKDEEEKAVAKAETPLPPPSSFADALLRKQAAKEANDELKGPSKPKLTAKTKETKTAWKIDKVPFLPSNGLSENSKSLLSCLLWRIYESDRNPLEPVRYILLAHNKEVLGKAATFGLGSATIALIQEQQMKTKKQQEKRGTEGELELQFPEILAMSKAFRTGLSEEIDTGPADFGFLDTQHVNGNASKAEIKIGEKTERSNSSMEQPSSLAPMAVRRIPQSIRDLDSSYTANPIEEAALGVSNIVTSTELEPEDAQQAYAKDVLGDLTEPKPSPLTSQSPVMSGEIKQPQGSESELESDEEIIVFNPRNRRTSGLPGSRSRPDSSSGFTQKTYKAGVRTNSRPTSSFGLTSLDGRIESLLNFDQDATGPVNLMQTLQSPQLPKTPNESNLKSPIESKLKAQSPVFTPGQPFMPGSPGLSIATVNLQSPGSPVNGINPPAGPRSTNARNQRSQAPQSDANKEMLRIQKANSQRIIQRQREAIQRQSKTVDTSVNVGESPSPRLIQMEPTDNPTVIDPDAFDRSYVVQPPSQQSQPSQRGSGEKRRSKGHHPRKSDKEAPKQNGQVAESDVDFVLKSGAPRGSTRGRGKLWVP